MFSIFEINSRTHDDDVLVRNVPGRKEYWCVVGAHGQIVCQTSMGYGRVCLVMARKNRVR